MGNELATALSELEQYGYRIVYPTLHQWGCIYAPNSDNPLPLKSSPHPIDLALSGLVHLITHTSIL